MSDQASSREPRARPTPSGGVAANEVKCPIHWPSLSVARASEEWVTLRHYVDDLRARYPYDLDAHAVPNCWYAHESHVMALQALRDYERVAYDPSSPASGAVDWHRAYRDVVALLRTFTANIRCSEEHVPSRLIPALDEKFFAEFVALDIARRRREAIDRALNDDGADLTKRG